MNNRIKQLRKNSLNATERISAERALLVTEFYKSNVSRGFSVPVQRAKAFEYILTNKKICINELELIVGERGSAPKATPTYPEITLHSVTDLDILNSRTKVSFKSDKKTISAYRDTIIPFWQGNTNRDKIFEAMTPEWLEAYSAGVFTEFQEQRAPGHTVAGDKIYKKGMLDIILDIENSIHALDYFSDANAYEKHEELKAMKISAQAIIMYANRHAEKLQLLAEKETDTVRKAELEEMSQICNRVPANKPQTFHQALQYYWFVHLGVITELNPWDSFNPGRLDQHLYPFYKKEVENGSMNPEKAKELLGSFWVKFNNHPAPPKIGVTALESNTFTDFSLINIGGLKPDGSNAVNEMSYIILDVVEDMHMVQPSSMVQISKKNPENFVRRAVKVVKTAFGQPSVFNTDAIVQQLLLQGKDIVDARNG
ncbi:MAG: pyruvate formate lyase family protein, partial [Bacteroidota bacterium]|nr:pyruvate formate lyase family protein [Bacteroidota bacterium]